MPSTYSPLKIELMATGEKNNTWGTITNTNLGTALEEAITGTADVTFVSGNVTLTLTDTNATQIARNLRLNLIGTTAGARDLIVPAIEKLYFINNTCADTITVKNATGTGIAVPAGKSMVVFNNATHVVDGITHLTSLTLASSLPVTSGGTGTTTSTGTGSVVLSNSPTLVTPALGTPASGVMTNVTGLPISTGVSGLGTGVATFLATPSSANLAAAVTDETGSGALVFGTSPTITSPTLVTPALGTPASGVMTNVTGLPISTGVSGLGTGVATFLGTPTSANLAAAVTDETGSGELVFGTSPTITSPTLVTPALGTPASGVMTNVTGLPIDAGTVNTLPVGRGGTGVTSLTSNGVVYGGATAGVTAAGATGQVLVGNTGAAPSWAAATSTAVTSLNFGSTGLTPSVATQGAITVAGTLAVANGGTGVTTSTGTGSVVLGTSPTITSASLVTPALGTPASGVMTNVTGLPISTGVSGLGTGVATFLGTPTSANLAAAVTDETGSGSLVFATSPTLVTPALGTPSSATLTNATGLPIGTGVSGLGTGVATFLATPSSANLAAAVTGETGSGALVFATSPALVTPALGTPASGVMTNVTGLPLTTGVTGTLPVGNGGTGATTLTTNGVIYGSGTGAVGVTAAGTTGQVLIGNTGAAPSWGAPPAAGVTSISFGTTGLTPSTATGGVITVAGTLAVANGGTGVTTSTGSGNVVLSTSPTLVTPALGTPSSATLTNATGLPISTGVSGLGTGVATFLGTPSSANLAAAVTDETGSGALVFATSPTLVTPVLGAASATSLALAAGLVATPSLTFTGDLNTGMWSPAADTIAWSTAGSERMRIDSGGNVGIGNTLPGYRLSVLFDANAQSQIQIANSNAGASATASIRLETQGNTWTINSNRNGGAFSIQDAVSARVWITNAGNVGIGTSTPANVALEVNGAVQTTPGSGGTLTVYDANVAVNQRLIAGADANGSYLDSTFGSGGTGALLFRTVGTEKMRIDSGGNVGIGTTGPAAKLHVSTTADGEMARFRRENGTNNVGVFFYANDATSKAQMFASGASGALDLGLGAAGAEVITIKGSGNVGIATTSPGAPLDVRGANGLGVRYIETTTGNTNRIELGTGSGFGYVSATAGVGSTALVFQVAGSELMRIAQDGNVGIGTSTTTGVKLTVAGSTAFTFAQFSTAHVVLGSTNSSGSLFINTPSLNGSFTSGLGISGSYASTTSTVNISAVGVYSGGGYGADLAFYTSADTTLPERMRITKGGNVGIGTTTPDVFGRFYTRSVGISSSGSSGIQLNSATGSGAYFDMGVNGARTFSIYSDATDSQLSTQSAGVLSLLVPGAGYIWFSTNGSERMRITSTGNVGIGTTSPGTKLDVIGAVRASSGAGGGYLGLDYSSASASSRSWAVYNDHTAFGDMNILQSSTQTGSPNTSRLYINPTGNVGIGTTGPVNKLQSTYTAPVSVPAAGASAHGFAVGDTGFGLAAGALNSGNAYLQATRWDGTATNYNLILQPNGGNVGIGTTGPDGAALLDLTSTTRGFLPPRMTTTQRDAISSPPLGLMIYNTTAGVIQAFVSGSIWVNL